MRAYLIALILIAASFSGGMSELDSTIVIIECENKGVENTTSSSYIERECEILEYEDTNPNRHKRDNKTGTEERKEEDSDSNSENGENRTRDSEETRR
tara:strand:- start:409 stop:702 length:294 start_codon:yes stop_codon:yes gene_type:complete